MTLADVLIFRGVGQTYSYDLGEYNEHNVHVGDHVNIRFGRSLATGLVISTREKNSSNTIHFKPIDSKNDSLPFLSSEFISMIEWFSQFYQCTPFKAYQTIIGKKKIRPVKLETSDMTTQSSPFTLSNEQQTALDNIHSISGFGCHLLHGITGSGKTEIYLRLAEQCLSNNTSIIILCPEISLTPQYTKQFKERFNDNVCLLHSGLTPKQKEEQWNKIMTLKASVIIGPRSAIFAPAIQLGLIVIDEEHDLSYKQDNHPRYDTQDVALWRGTYHQCPVVLGSATPAIETYAKAKHKVDSSVPFSYSKLINRVSGHPLPKIKTIDMLSIKQNGDFSLISNQLLDSMKIHLNRNKKVIILINRRGFSTHISCQHCGSVLACKGCGLSYTFHQNKSLHCHRCDLSIPLTHHCPSCKKNRLGFSGIGIQKVELECRQYFPDASIIRLDKDSASTGKKIEEKLDLFKQDGDILIGTQMVAKGHHIEDVTLVGVLGIDTSLNLPDYRSAERAFHLLLQVAGRSGRGEDPGEVVVQTFQPNHYIFSFSEQHNIDGFTERELQFRQDLFYPPFSDMVHLIISSESIDFASSFADVVATHIRSSCCPLSDSILISGPNPAPIEKVRNFYRFQLILKFPHSKQSKVRDILSSAPKPTKHVRYIIDFSPKQLL